MHKPMAQATHRPRVKHRVAVRTRPCRGTHWHRVADYVVVRTGHVVSRIAHTRCCVTGPSVTIQSLYRNTGPYHALCCSTPMSCRRALGALLQPLACCVVTSGLPLLSRYNDCIATHPASQAVRTSCRTPLRAGQPCRGPIGRVVGLCRRAFWPYRGPPIARPCALCQDTIHCIVTQTGKWAVAYPVSNTIFFFRSFCSSYCKTTKYFHVFSRTKKIFILNIFFSFFTHCKTSKKFLQYTFFSYVLFTKHTNHTIHTQQSMLYTQSHIKHNACSVLTLSCDCLGNHIPKL